MVCDRLAGKGPLGKNAEFECGAGFYREVLAGKASGVAATDVTPGILVVAK
jgi:hypothetical protein